MFLLCVAIFIVTTEVTVAQFDPVVTFDCKNGVGDVDVSVTSASLTGKVSMYVGNNLCAEQSTTSTPIVVSFTATAGCTGPASYPGTSTPFLIYVTEGSSIQAGYPDEVYRVTCNADDSESYTELVLTTVGTIKPLVQASFDLEITDVSDVTMTTLVVGTSYKFKINCQDSFVNDFDILVQKITANSVLTLIDNGCTQYPSVFNNPTYPSLCRSEAVFFGFLVGASTTPETLIFDAWVGICAGPCTLPAACASGRKRRDANSVQGNTTLEIVHLYKEITVYPRNETKEEHEGPITSSDTQKEMCFSYPLVYVIFSLFLILFGVTVALGILLFLARRRSRSQGSRDSKKWWHGGKNHLSHSSAAVLREPAEPRKY